MAKPSIAYTFSTLNDPDQDDFNALAIRAKKNTVLTSHGRPPWSVELQRRPFEVVEMLNENAGSARTAKGYATLLLSALQVGVVGTSCVAMWRA